MLFKSDALFYCLLLYLIIECKIVLVLLSWPNHSWQGSSWPFYLFIYLEHTKTKNKKKKIEQIIIPINVQFYIIYSKRSR